ncbi:MAG: hypothetical protein HKP56_04110 [Anderseniella sp.]|nr:hypothetical protein [Anderseniella sp.]
MADPAKLIVVMMYDADPETGLPYAAGEPMQFDNSEKAIRVAQGLADKHAGVIAWARSATPDLGEYGEPEILYQAGEIGDLD